jgi:hypothetical protein
MKRRVEKDIKGRYNESIRIILIGFDLHYEMIFIDLLHFEAILSRGIGFISSWNDFTNIRIQP